MDIQTYSLLLTIAALFLLAFSLFITFNKEKTLNNILNRIFNLNINDKNFILYILAIISGCSILGALVYEYIYNTEPCYMCWWGRIFLFPIFPISLLALKYKITNIAKIISLLAGLGLVVAIYHYYFHFNVYVLGNILSMPCDTNPLTPSCVNNNGVLVFGLFTIPAMGILNFISMILLANKIKD